MYYFALTEKKLIVEHIVGMKYETVVFRSHVQIFTVQESMFAYGLIQQFQEGMGTHS
jgi:hypothetical protein